MPLEPSFSYSNPPQPVKKVKTKYRKKNEDLPVNLNLMNDPRIARGSTTKQRLGKEDQHRTNTIRPPTQMNEFDQMCPSYRYLVEDYISSDVDISKYLIEDPIKSHRLHSHIDSQTDKFVDLPPTPDYIPRKSGVDKFTQVENVNELFIFDLEVEPLLNVIVSKTIEQAVFEVQREEELASISSQCEKYFEEKKEEVKWTKKREDETIAETCLKDLTLKGRQEKFDNEFKVRQLIAVGSAMRQIFPNMVDVIQNSLVESGIWIDPTSFAISQVLSESAEKFAIEKENLYNWASKLLDEILLNANDYVTKPQSTSYLRVILPASKAGRDEDIILGPIEIRNGTSIEELENAFQNELRHQNTELNHTFSLREYLQAIRKYMGLV